MPPLPVPLEDPSHARVVNGLYVIPPLGKGNDMFCEILLLRSIARTLQIVEYFGVTSVEIVLTLAEYREGVGPLSRVDMWRERLGALAVHVLRDVSGGCRARWLGEIGTARRTCW